MKELSSKVSEESLNMMAFRLLRSTSSMQKGTALHRWWTQLCRDYVSSGQHPTRGRLRIIMTSVGGEKSDRTLKVECVTCGKFSRRSMTNVCRAASNMRCGCSGTKYQDKDAARVLGYRYEAMVQRCMRDTHVSSANYKGRGIEVRMTRSEFISWALEKWPSRDYLSLDFDREDNDGHYELSNLRLLTRSENLMNTRRSEKALIRRARKLLLDHPWVTYAEKTVWNKMQAGATELEILKEAKTNAHLCGVGAKPDSAMGLAKQWLTDRPDVEFCAKYVVQLWRERKDPATEWSRRQKKVRQGIEGRVRAMLASHPHLTYAPAYMSKLLKRGMTEEEILARHKSRKPWSRGSRLSERSGSTTS